MAVFDTWARLIELQPHYSWIIDRFHLSARAFQLTEHGLDLDFRDLEQRLRALDVHVVLCTRREGTWEAARAARLKVSGKPSQYDDLDPFRREQDLLRRLASESVLPVLELDTSDGDIGRRLRADRRLDGRDRGALAEGGVARPETPAIDGRGPGRTAPGPCPRSRPLVTLGTHAHLRISR